MNIIIQEDIQYVLAQNLPWERLRNKTVLVSGANGFLPSFLVKTLLALNEKKHNFNLKVIGVVRNKEKALKRFEEYTNDSHLELITQDICEKLKIEQDIHFIIHAASQASPTYYHTDPVGTLSANILGTYNLLELAKEKQIEKFLFFSSAEIYGKLENDDPITETSYGYLDPTDVRSCYGESKRMGETMCVSWHHQYGIPVNMVRPFHTYGPGMDLHDGRVFADFVSNIIERKNIVMKSDGSARRAFCYLADATAGFLTVLLKGKDSEAYNVANDAGEISIKNLAEELVSIFPERHLNVVREERNGNDGYATNQVKRYLPDISKINKLGWKPQYGIKDGFKRTILSYEEKLSVK